MIISNIVTILNDIEAFEEVSLKIAMQNGHKNLKDLADYICPSLINNGVSEAINKFIL